MDLSKELNLTILALYRDGKEVPPHRFKQWCFDLIRKLLPFDSGIWVTSDIVSNTHSSVFLYHQSMAMITNYNREVGIANDALAQLVIRESGRTFSLEEAWPPESFRQSHAYLNHCKYYGIEQALCTAHVEDVVGIPSSISLYRADRERRFSEEERRSKELLFPHLLEAYRQNLFSTLISSPLDGQSAVALCDRNGLLYETTANFIALIGEAIPDWRGPSLAKLMPANWQQLSRWQSGNLIFKAAPFEDIHLITLRVLSAVDSLTDRERDVARLRVSGKPYKKIASELGIAQATVVKHVNSINQKLRIKTPEDLHALLKDRDF